MRYFDSVEKKIISVPSGGKLPPKYDTWNKEWSDIEQITYLTPPNPKDPPRF
jgi:hypothetical protein